MAVAVRWRVEVTMGGIQRCNIKNTQPGQLVLGNQCYNCRMRIHIAMLRWTSQSWRPEIEVAVGSPVGGQLGKEGWGGEVDQINCSLLQQKHGTYVPGRCISTSA